MLDEKLIHSENEKEDTSDLVMSIPQPPLDTMTARTLTNKAIIDLTERTIYEIERLIYNAASNGKLRASYDIPGVLFADQRKKNPRSFRGPRIYRGDQAHNSFLYHFLKLVI